MALRTTDLTSVTCSEPSEYILSAGIIYSVYKVHVSQYLLIRTLSSALLSQAQYFLSVSRI